jgi:hypothetical protein
MAIPLNASADVACLRGGDGVRIGGTAGDDGLQELEIDLAERRGDAHCLVALPALPNEIPGAAEQVRVWLGAEYHDGVAARVPFILYLVAFHRERAVAEVQMRFFAGPERTSLILDGSIPHDADRYQLVVYADRRYRGVLRLTDVRLVSGTTEYRIGPGHHLARPVALKRDWRQEGSRVVCRSAYGEHWAEMPSGWRLDEVHPAALAAADWILYAGADKLAFGVVAPPPVSPAEGDRQPGPTSVLSFSLGTDSTAAMTLLPDDTVRYYCHRPYTVYHLRNGAAITLPDPAPWEGRLRNLANLIVVPNTFEEIQLAAGGRHGYAHNFGYAAIGLLLADYLDAGALAFGSVLEQVFLRSGHLFADVVAIERSAYNSLRAVLASAGMVLTLPTAGCSEVLTTRIADAGRFAGLAISCPRAAPDGSPCGTCFKCFRKLRLEGAVDPADPEPAVLQVLEKYPLKSATSVVYAAQRSGYRHRAVDEYLDVDLTFLERYFDYAVRHMVPMHLAGHVRSALDALGIDPMSEDDELKLRTIGQFFWPESFSWARAGIAEPA